MAATTETCRTVDEPRMSDERGTNGPTGERWSAKVESVYREHGKELWALFYAHCNDPDRAYDALQESFVRLQGQNGEEIRDPRAWLLRVGRNWLRDVARRQRVAAKPSEGLDTLPNDGDEPRNELVHAERLDQVREGLDHLKADDREVLVLRYALGWSSIRISEVLGSSPSAIDMRLSRARKRLAKYLESIGARE